MGSAAQWAVCIKNLFSFFDLVQTFWLGIKQLAVSGSVPIVWAAGSSGGSGCHRNMNGQVQE